MEVIVFDYQRYVQRWTKSFGARYRNWHSLRNMYTYEAKLFIGMDIDYYVEATENIDFPEIHGMDE